MKVRDLIIQLLNSDMDAEVLVSTGNTIDDVSDFTLGWGPLPDGAELKEAKRVRIEFLPQREEAMKGE